MWPFTCAVCKEKDKRIADLKAMLNPSPVSRVIEQEEDLILSGAGTEQKLPLFPPKIEEENNEEILKRNQALQFEHDAMLSGETIEIPS